VQTAPLDLAVQWWLPVRFKLRAPRVSGELQLVLEHKSKINGTKVAWVHRAAHLDEEKDRE